MNENQPLKETTPFTEFTSVSTAADFHPEFDIEKIPNQSLENYCSHLLARSLLIKLSQIPDFICHHTKLVKEPLLWLMRFEKLLALNEQLFFDASAHSRIIKLYTSIETRRNKLLDEQNWSKKGKPAKKYINAESEDRYFSFYKLKKKMQNLCGDSEKILLLTKEKFEYQQSVIEFLNINTLEFDKQCDKEIEHILALKKLKEELEKDSIDEKSPGTSQPKAKINININQIADVFYQLSTFKTTEGLPYIEANINQLAAIIVNNFIDKDENPISPQTVKTILKPSKEEKRPNTGKRIDLNKLL